MKLVGYFLSALAVIVILAVFSNELGLQIFSHYGVKYANVERQVFENTQAYNQGMVRDFENLQMQYVQAKDDNQKAMLRDVILHRMAGYPTERLTPELQRFYAQLQN